MMRPEDITDIGQALAVALSLNAIIMLAIGFGLGLFGRVLADFFFPVATDDD